jgi:hypothetical protein
VSERSLHVRSDQYGGTHIFTVCALQGFRLSKNPLIKRWVPAQLPRGEQRCQGVGTQQRRVVPFLWYLHVQLKDVPSKLPPGSQTSECKPKIAFAGFMQKPKCSLRRACGYSSRSSVVGAPGTRKRSRILARVMLAAKTEETRAVGKICIPLSVTYVKFSFLGSSLQTWSGQVGSGLLF